MKTSHTQKLAGLLALSLSLSSCIDLAPFYTRPAAPVPATLGNAASDQKAFTDLPWQSYISDEKLRQVIALALTNNRDLQVAALTIERSRALYQVQRADLFPTVAASVTETASKGMASAANNTAGNTAGQPLARRVAVTAVAIFRIYTVRLSALALMSSTCLAAYTTSTSKPCRRFMPMKRIGAVRKSA